MSACARQPFHILAVATICQTYDACHSNCTLILKPNGTRIFHHSHAHDAPHKLISLAIAFNCHREDVQTSENERLRSKPFTDKNQAQEASEINGKRTKHDMLRGGGDKREVGGANVGGGTPHRVGGGSNQLAIQQMASEGQGKLKRGIQSACT
jgi:hypothetical protein